jgi:hypothetical protein
MKVAMYQLPSTKSESGPRSTEWPFWPRKDGRIAKPATGTVTMPPISPPSPSVAPSRKRLARRARLPPLRLDDDRVPAQLCGGVARPEEAADDRDRAADRRDEDRVDDEPDEDDDDADREAERPERRHGQVRLGVQRLRTGGLVP